jgi:glycosyltransferase involved in cell wall biosynthesis
MSEPRVLIICHDVVGSRMAGPGIRAWEMARALAAQQPVTLAAPRAIDLAADGVACASFALGEAEALAPLLAEADVVVANGMVLAHHPELAGIAQPLAVDIYDPVALENLELMRGAAPEERAAQAAADLVALRRQLLSGDCLLCATARQRDLYLGGLVALGRITPELADGDPLLERLLAVVPFGLPAEPPPPPRPALRRQVEGIDERSQLVLWSGGLWDWMDPLALIRAAALLRDELPALRVAFLAGSHPGMARPGGMAERARSLAAELGLLDATVFFYDYWVPYERRADFLAEADVLAYLHRAHLESAYAAVRSRFLDHLWVGRASLVAAGDAAAELVERHGLGRVAPAESPQGVALALRELLADDAGRRAMAARAGALAAEYRWERTLEPLRAFCKRPIKVTNDKRMNELTAGTSATNTGESGQGGAADADANTARNAAVERLDGLWQVRPAQLGSAVPLLGQAKQAANSLTRWYVQGIVEQQNAFNAALVQALQQIADADDRRHSLAIGSAAEAHQLLGQLQRQIVTQNEWMTNVTAALQSLHASILDIQNATAPLHQHVADIEQHLIDIDDAQTELARRLAELPEGPGAAP